MNTLTVILLVFAYVVIGRVFAQVYTNIEGWEYVDYNDAIFWRTLLWPFILIWWIINSFVEWLDDNFM